MEGGPPRAGTFLWDSTASALAPGLRDVFQVLRWLVSSWGHALGVTSESSIQVSLFKCRITPQPSKLVSLSSWEGEEIWNMLFLLGQLQPCPEIRILCLGFQDPSRQQRLCKNYKVLTKCEQAQSHSLTPVYSLHSAPRCKFSLDLRCGEVNG